MLGNRGYSHINITNDRRPFFVVIKHLSLYASFPIPVHVFFDVFIKGPDCSEFNFSHSFIDYELFGIEVVGGRMCTGGFLCVYVAKVVEGSSALQCIREG